MAPKPQQNPKRKTWALAAKPALAMASVQPGKSQVQAIRGIGTVAMNTERKDEFSTVYRRISRYWRPKAPPATAATTMGRKPRNRVVMKVCSRSFSELVARSAAQGTEEWQIPNSRCNSIWNLEFPGCAHGAENLHRSTLAPPDGLGSGRALRTGHHPQVFARPHEFVLLEERLGHHEVAQLGKGAVDVLLAAAEHEDAVAGQEHVKAQVRELGQVPPVVVEAAPLEVDQPEPAAIEEDVAGEQAAAALVLERHASGVPGMAGRADHRQLERPHRDAIPVAKRPIGLAGHWLEAGRVAAEFQVDSDPGIVPDIRHGRGTGRRGPDPCTGPRPQLARPAPVADMGMRNEDVRDR